MSFPIKKNYRKYLTCFLISFIVLYSFIACSTSVPQNLFNFDNYSTKDYENTIVDETSILEAYNNSYGDKISINIPTNDEYNHTLNVEKQEDIIELFKKYEWQMNKDGQNTEKSIQKIIPITTNNKSISLKSNTGYIFGKGQYNISSINYKNLENVVLIGKGAYETVLVGAIGIFDSKNIFISNLSVYYEQNKELAYSSIAIINTENAFLENVLVTNSSNGAEFGHSTVYLSNFIGINNKDTNIYAYDETTLKINNAFISGSRYNGMYVEESELFIKNSSISENDVAGIYARKSYVNIHKTIFKANSKYGIQLKYSTLNIFDSQFEKGGNKFDYSGDIYLNPFSSYKTNIHKKSFNIITPKYIDVKTQKELENAIVYAQANDNVFIKVSKGTYIVESILSGREDIFIVGSNDSNTDFEGYLAFASCYDIDLEYLDMRFKGNAFNGIEFKNTYFAEIKNCRIKSAKQNGLQIASSIVSIDGSYIQESGAVGLVSIASGLKISNSVFERNEISGISGIGSDISIDRTTLRDNKTQSGLTILDSKAKISNSTMENNGITGISSENSFIKVNNCKSIDNGLSGIEVASSNVEIDSTEFQNNKEYAIIILKLSKVNAKSLFILGQGVGGLYIDGNSSVNLYDSNIRKSNKYGIIIKNNNKADVDIQLTNISLLYLEYGLYFDNGKAKINNITIDNISHTGIYLMKNSIVNSNQILFGDNVSEKIFKDNSSTYIEN